MKNCPAASKFAGNPFQQGISDSHSPLKFSENYAAPIGAFFCPEILAFTGDSSTISKARSDRKVLFEQKNGPVNSR